MEFISHSPADLHIPARKLIDLIAEKSIVVLEGEMGAGKTTFSKILCREMGVDDEVSSPTFSLVNEYLLHDGKSVFHFDFYRINDISEAEDMGIYEYFDNGICLIEWGEKIASILEKEDRILVKISVKDDKRFITFEKCHGKN
jgi:tRNA threonylcarbamoyladenosine biosynthesis protein TsaE